MGSKKQTLAMALRDSGVRCALNGLVGCPAGGWPETAQARSRIVDEVPFREDRAYKVSDLISAALDLDHADRYRWKDGV